MACQLHFKLPIVATFTLSCLCATLTGANAQEEPVYRRPASEIAVKLEHDHELGAHLESLAKNRRWAALVSTANYALTTPHGVLLNPKNRIRESDSDGSQSGKHSIFDERSRCHFVIRIHWNLTIGHLGLGNVKQAVFHAKQLPKLFEALENATDQDSGQRTPEIDLAVAAEQRSRKFLSFGQSEAYLECINPYIPVLENNATKDKSGAAADSLSMVRLVQGNWDAADKYASTSLHLQHPGNFFFGFQHIPNQDFRHVIPMITRKQPQAAASHLSQFAFNLNTYYMHRSTELTTVIDRTPREYLEHPDTPFLAESIASFAAVDPALVVPSLECLMGRKRKLGSRMRGFAAWTYRQGSDFGRDHTFRALAQAGGTSLIARGPAHRMQANSEAEGLFNINTDALPNADGIQDVFDTDADWPKVDKLQKLINSESAVIECALTQSIDFENVKNGLRWRSPRYVAWFIQSEGPPVFIDIGPQSEVESLVTQIQRFVAEPPPAGEEHEHCDASLELANRILGPLKSQSRRIKKLLICADGALWLLPWAALPLERNKFLAEECEISFADTAAARLTNPGKHQQQINEFKARIQAGANSLKESLVKEGKTPAEIEEEIKYYLKHQDTPLGFEDPAIATSPVIIADADYDAAPSNVLLAESKFFRPNTNIDQIIVPVYDGKSLIPKVKRLPGTAREAVVVAEAMQLNRKLKARVFTGRDALESVVRTIKNPEILVFATHGFFIPQQASPTSLPSAPLKEGGGAPTGELPSLEKTKAGNVRPDQDVTVGNQSRNASFLKGLPAGYQPLDLIDNSYFRCGLLLTGANHCDKWGEIRSSEGILTGLDVALMDLRGTKLVVLSACETGVGDPTAGEGVASLRQAFHMAGAEAVISTLWQVPDNETAELMSDFFTAYQARITPAVALRQSQLKQIARRRELYETAHPYYWAAFSVTER